MQRYSPDTLAARVAKLAPGLLTPLMSERHAHHTPKGNVQDFQFSCVSQEGAIIMKNVKVYGPGCNRCATTEQMVKFGQGCRG